MADSSQQEEANMADNKSVYVDIVDENAALFLANTTASQKKKSCFQITSVKVSENTNNDDNESIDDLDESHAEDVSSDVLDISKTTDVDQSEDNLYIPVTQELNTNYENINQNSHSSNGHGNGPSRFRVVKVETIEPIKRGRWTCTDYLDPVEKEQINVQPDRTVEKEPTGSGNSSAASSVHYVPGQDSSVENPLNVTEQQHQSAAAQTQPQQNQAQTQNQPATQPTQPQQSQNAVNNFENAASAAAPQNNGQESIQSSTTQTQPPSNPIDYGSHSMVEHIRDSLSVDMSSGAPSTDGQSEGEDSASGASVGAIDNKIEQAMDLVKSHLMYAVREEVEVLKEQIKELIERNSQLEKENSSLRQQQQQQAQVQQQAQQQAAAAAVASAAAPPQTVQQPQQVPQSQQQPGQPQMQSPPNQSTPTEPTAAQAVMTQSQS